MPFDNVTSKNAHLYAMKEYDNPQCMTEDEFNEDYKKFKYVKRLCRRYLTTGHLSERLMLNHLILLVNVFGPAATTRILFVKCDDERLYRVLKPFLLYLNVLPELVKGINGKTIVTSQIPLDDTMFRELQDL